MTSSNKPLIQDRSAKLRILAEQLQAIYQQGPLPMLISMLMAGVVCRVMWDVGGHVHLVAWFTLVILASFWGAVILVSYKQEGFERVEIMLQWENRFFAALIFTSLAWGVGGVWIMPKELIAHQVFIFFFQLGMASGAIIAYSTHSKMVQTSVFMFLLPSSIWFAFQGSIIHWAMSFSVFVYLATTSRLVRTMENSLHRTFQLSIELEIATEKANQLASIDNLTKLRNRRTFNELAEVGFAEAKRYEMPLSLTLFDIDRFKEVNDNWGHAAGDEALRALGEIIRNTVRAADIAGRFGGDEFIILMLQTSVDDAKTQVDRLRKQISDLVLLHDGDEFSFTCSFGLAERTKQSTSINQLINQADKALYLAKDRGGNNVTVHFGQPSE